MASEFDEPNVNVPRKPHESLLVLILQRVGSFLSVVGSTVAVFVNKNPGIALLGCCVFMFSGQLWALKSVVDLESEREVWSLTVEDRQLRLSSLEQNYQSLIAEISGHSKKVGEMKAEVSTLKLEYDRSTSELVEVQKQLSLARNAESEAIKTQQTAIQESQIAVDAKLAAEQRVAELITEKAKLVSDVQAAREQNAPLIKGTDEAKVLLAKINGDIAISRKQLSDGQAQADAIQGKLGELRTQLVKESQGLESAVTENGKILRKREEVLAEVSAAELKLGAIKIEQEKRKADNDELQKGIMELDAKKIELSTSVGDLQKRLGEAQNQIGSKTKELELLTTEVQKAAAEEKRLQEAIKNLSEKLPPENAELPNKPTGN